MERLTERIDGIAMPKFELYKKSEVVGDKKGYMKLVNMLTDKLAEYEDLEKQGKIIKLPCKVGDKVYFIKSMFSYSKSPMEGMICMIKTFSLNETFTFGVIMDSDKQERSFTNCDIGKTVFLTHKEAEKVLEVKENDK